MSLVMEDDYIYLLYGKQDKDSYILKLNLTALVDSLEQISAL